MLDPKDLKNGEHQYEKYFSTNYKDYLIQYDYRHTNGELFSTVKRTLKECEAVKDKWVARQEQLGQEQQVILEEQEME